jgi:type II secretory pathway pseudopilin PulG
MRRRQGFTIVELLVALALIIFIMSILSDAFATASKTFRDLKAIGDMAERLRTAGTILRNDLAQDHFTGRRRLSDPSFWTDGPPPEGFFRIWQVNASPYVGQEGGFVPGVDIANSIYATSHALHFAAKKRSNDPGEFYSATLPPPAVFPGTATLLSLGQPDGRFQQPSATVLKSQWAEVIWFLGPNGATAGSTPLYSLYRRQRVVLPESESFAGRNGSLLPGTLATLGNLADEVSCWQRGTNIYFNTPNDLTVPQRRFGMNPNQNAGVPLGATGAGFAPNAPYAPRSDGADLVLSDVLSFSVRVMVSSADPNTPWHLLSDFPNNNSILSGAGASVFDTWTRMRDDSPDAPVDYSIWNSSAVPDRCVPAMLQIYALEITIRVWDFKTERARQITIIQDM